MANDKLVANLLAERKQLESQLSAINKQLRAIDELLAARGHAPEPGPKLTVTSWNAPTSPITKAEAIRKALKKAKAPVKPRDLPALMEQEGYVFSGKSKTNALNNLLYGAHRLKDIANTSDGLSLKK